MIIEEEIPRCPRQSVPVPGGPSEKNHPAVPADVLGTEVQRGRRPQPEAGEASSRDELLVFTNQQQCYKTRLSDFDATKASALGDYLPTKLGMDEERRWSGPASPGTTPPTSCSALKTARWPGCPCPPTRPRATAAGSPALTATNLPLVACLLLTEEREYVLISTEGRAVIFNSAVLAPKTTRSTQGVGS